MDRTGQTTSGGRGDHGLIKHDADLACTTINEVDQTDNIVPSAYILLWRGWQRKVILVTPVEWVCPTLWIQLTICQSSQGYTRQTQMLSRCTCIVIQMNHQMTQAIVTNYQYSWIGTSLQKQTNIESIYNRQFVFQNQYQDWF